MEHLRAFRAATEQEDVIRFIASTAGVKRDGIDLDQSRWDLENYRKNPVVLWSHDYWGEHLPIGRASVEVEGENLVADVVFDATDPFAQQVKSKFERGFLNAVSVGWDVIRERDKDERYELLDISAVPVPGDPDALIERQREGLRSLKRTLESVLDEPKNESEHTPQKSDAVWRGVASAMLDLFRNHTAIEDEDRRAIYNSLERAYRKLGKTPPEFMTAEELGALDDGQIRGLFLAGEVDETLLPSERQAVRRAVDVLLQHVISQNPDPVEEPQEEPTTTDFEQLQQLSEWLDKEILNDE